jgi:hypothetical protein
VATLNWESENRRKNLAKWVAQNDLSPKWWEKDPGYEQDLEAWAKRQAAKVVAKINKVTQESVLKNTLENLSDAIQINDLTAMKLYAEQALNYNSIRSRTSKDVRYNLTLLVQMVLCMSEDTPSGSSESKRN